MMTSTRTFRTSARLTHGVGILLLLIGTPGLADESFSWPDGQTMAISLSYDDAIDSQLDNAIPALNRYGFRASFYLTLASPTILNRLDEWRAAAEQGHELGNHTIYHPCSASLPDRDWVASFYDIDNYEVDQIVNEVTVANSMLHAIDGRSERTFTAPCGDLIVGGESYLSAVEHLFVAIKFSEPVESGFAAGWGPAEVTGKELIERVQREAENGTRLFNLLFHGIGGDYLTVSSEAHEELLAYLAANDDIYWVDSYINIMRHVRAEYPASGVR